MYENEVELSSLRFVHQLRNVQTQTEMVEILGINKTDNSSYLVSMIDLLIRGCKEQLLKKATPMACDTSKVNSTCDCLANWCNEGGQKSTSLNILSAALFVLLFGAFS